MFGYVLFELVCNQKPFEGKSDEEVVRFTASGGIPKKPEKLHPKLWRLLQSCWHLDPKERPSFKEVSKSLEKLKKLLDVEL